MSRHKNHCISKMHQILAICLAHNHAEMCHFVLYLSDIHQIDGNTTFNNEFYNLTKSRFYYYTNSNRAVSTTFVVTSL